MSDPETTASTTELIVPGPAHALGSLLGVPVPDLDAGEPLPLLWHWVYLLDHPATADLGPDGHPVRGTVPRPPGPGRRRMWAGGRVTYGAGLRVDAVATRRTSVVSTVDKAGRSGPLTFVTVRHEIVQDGRIALEEEQDIVYRDADLAAQPRATGDAEPLSPTADEWAVATPTTLLFRFSALTYNAHRIHYDRDYARDVEGYPGLVVHGPLQVMLMAEAVRRRQPVTPVGTTFSYRLVAPVFDAEGLVVSTAAAGPAAVRTTVRSGTGTTSATGLYQAPDGDR